MSINKITELAVKRHDIDAPIFQNVYTTTTPELLNKKETVFLKGRELVLQELSEILEKLPKGSKVLDVGCGTAHLTQWIKEQGFDVYGIEPSIEMFTYAKKNFPDIEIKQAISSKIPYEDNFFNLIVSFEVLRYLDKQENIESYKEFYRVLKTGGSFFVTQVNMFSTDFYYFFHKVVALKSKITKKIHHHCNFTNAYYEEKILKQNGFSSVKTTGRLMGSTRIFYKLGVKVGNAYNSIMNKIFNGQKFKKSFYKNFTGHLIVNATK